MTHPERWRRRGANSPIGEGTGAPRCRRSPTQTCGPQGSYVESGRDRQRPTQVADRRVGYCQYDSQRISLRASTDASRRSPICAVSFTPPKEEQQP
jgi:hypothetical protein